MEVYSAPNRAQSGLSPALRNILWERIKPYINNTKKQDVRPIPTVTSTQSHNRRVTLSCRASRGRRPYPPLRAHCLAAKSERIPGRSEEHVNILNLTPYSDKHTLANAGVSLSRFACVFKMYSDCASCDCRPRCVESANWSSATIVSCTLTKSSSSWKAA